MGIVIVSKSILDKNEVVGICRARRGLRLDSSRSRRRKPRARNSDGGCPASVSSSAPWTLHGKRFDVANTKSALPKKRNALLMPRQTLKPVLKWMDASRRTALAPTDAFQRWKKTLQSVKTTTKTDS